MLSLIFLPLALLVLFLDKPTIKKAVEKALRDRNAEYRRRRCHEEIGNNNSSQSFPRQWLPWMVDRVVDSSTLVGKMAGVDSAAIEMGLKGFFDLV